MPRKIAPPAVRRFKLKEFAAGFRPRIPPGGLGEILPAGRHDLRPAASEDEVAVVEIGCIDAFQDEDVGAACEHHVLVELHHVQI
jgi:hypothetical protein